jgi:hypothetical protein
MIGQMMRERRVNKWKIFYIHIPKNPASIEYLGYARLHVGHQSYRNNGQSIRDKLWVCFGHGVTFKETPATRGRAGAWSCLRLQLPL